MASASDLAERNRLKAMGEGIQIWIDENVSDNDRALDVVRIGRWRQFHSVPEHTLEYEYGEAYKPCDLAVIFGSWKPREKGTHQTRTSVAHNAPAFLVIETPLLGRRTDQVNQYWRIGINGYLNRDAMCTHHHVCDQQYTIHCITGLFFCWMSDRNRCKSPWVSRRLPMGPTSPSKFILQSLLTKISPVTCLINTKNSLTLQYQSGNRLST